MAVADYMPILLRPSLLLGLSIYNFIATIFENLISSPSNFPSLTSLRFQSFSRLWRYNAAAMSEEMPEGLDELLSTVSGVVLDIGPGTGEILKRMKAGGVKKMYGAEPATDMHAQLRENVKKNGWEGKYVVLGCGAEPESLVPALGKEGLLDGGGAEGVFDEICCVRVLCGVPRPEETIQTLYGLLKPGGRMVVCEHVVNPWRTEGFWLARFMQAFYTVAGWPFFMGGCELQRHTPEYLKKAAGKEGWEKFDLKYVEPKTAIPFVVGELRKKK